jgi:hypothetical protein
MTPRKPPAAEPYDPLKGCMCRVCTGAITVDPAALQAVPDELVEAFERASSEAVHASPHNGTEDDYIRGGLAAVLPAYAAKAMRDVTVKQWGDTLEAIVNDSVNERLADLERDIRAKVAEEIAAGIERIFVLARRDQRPAEAKADAYRDAAQIARNLGLT